MDETIGRQSSSCVMHLTQVCQVVIGDALLWPAWPIEDFGVPLRSRARRVVLHRRRAGDGHPAHPHQGLGALIHRRVHAAYPSEACAFNPSMHFVPSRIDPANPETWKPGEAMRGLGESFRRGPRVCPHPLPVSERAKERLRVNLTEKITVAAVARHSGCSVAVLRRRFAKESRETPGRYRARIRTLKAIELLRNADWKVEAVARAVGWKSRRTCTSGWTTSRGSRQGHACAPQTDVDRVFTALGGAKLVRYVPVRGARVRGADPWAGGSIDSVIGLCRISAPRPINPRKLLTGPAGPLRLQCMPSA